MKSAFPAKKSNFRKGIPPSQRLITEFCFPLQPNLPVTAEMPPTALSNLVTSSSTPDARTRFSMLMTSSTETTGILHASSVQSTVSTPMPLLPHLKSSSTVWYSAYSHSNIQSSACPLNQANLYLSLAPPKNSASANHTPEGTPRLFVNGDPLAQSINAASSAGSSIINAPGPARRSNNPAWPNCYSHQSSPSALRSEQ